MSTPFDSQPAVTAIAGPRATAAQLGFIRNLLAQHEWQRVAGRAWVERAAAIATAIHLAENPEKLDIVLDDDSLDAAVEQILDFTFAATVADERDPGAWKPLSKTGASQMIEWLKGLPKVPAEQAQKAAGVPVADEVPAGRYAVETEDGATNELAFYKVDRPTEGRWAGYVFVKHLVSDEEHRMSQSAGAAILRKIAAVGAEAASARYGHEIGECGVCGRTLTNDESRARGIGPVCAEKF